MKFFCGRVHSYGFKKIPQKFDVVEVAAELKALLLYSGWFEPGAVRFTYQYQIKWPRKPYSRSSIG
jgi:hypothetical protein